MTFLIKARELDRHLASSHSHWNVTRRRRRVLGHHRSHPGAAGQAIYVRERKWRLAQGVMDARATDTSGSSADMP